MFKKIFLASLLIGSLMSFVHAQRAVYLGLGTANFNIGQRVSDKLDGAFTSYVLGFESIDYAGNNFLTGAGFELEKEKNMWGVTIQGKLAYSIHDDMNIYAPIGLKYIKGEEDFNAVGVGIGVGFSYHIPNSPVGIGIEYKTFEMWSLKDIYGSNEKDFKHNRIGVNFKFFY